MGRALQNLNITYHRSVRAKHLRITIAPSRAVSVTVPVGTSLERAKEFVLSRQAWIQKHLTKMRQMEKLREEQPELSREQLAAVQDELFERLDRFSQKYNLPYNRAAFRCQKTKWGSCSSRQNISLNINIAFLPKHLQDYILLHELCHLRHMNHSKAFWSRLDQYCGGNAKAYAKELKTHPMKIRA